MADRDNKTSRKDRIIGVATKVFARNGFAETTISDIAKGAKVAEATIYEYFSTKEGLLFAIPLEPTRRFIEYGEFHLKLMSGAANRLRAIAYLFMDFYQNNPDYAAVSLLILKPNTKFRETEAYDLIRQAFGRITTAIEEGVESGELRDDVDPYVIRSLIMGAVDHVTTNWLLKGRQGDLLRLVDPIMASVMEGILLRPAPDDPASRPKWSDWTGSGPGKSS